MTDSDDNLVRSNILLGAINAFLVISSYLAVAFLAHVFLKEMHDINILSMIEMFSQGSLPILAEMFSFLGFLFESTLIHTAIISLFYAAYVSNYEIKLDGEILHVKKGFLIIDINKIPLENIQSVYTEKYTFFLKTKQLCIRTLDEDVIKIPYVPHADKFKSILVDKVKAHNMHIETTKVLHEPIQSVALNPQ